MMWGKTGDCIFMVMELVEGITLKEYIQKKGKTDTEGSNQHYTSGMCRY